MRQKARSYIFSNSLPPAVAMAAIEALRILSADNALVQRVAENTSYFRKQIQSLGFRILEGAQRIVPIMLGETAWLWR